MRIRGAVWKKSPFHAVFATTMLFTFLNVLLPLNFPALAIRYPFKLAITLEKTTYKLDETVSVTWTLTNIGRENVTLYQSADSAIDFIIRDNNFKHVFKYEGYYVTGKMYFPFPPLIPGGSRTTLGAWKQIYDGSETINPQLWYKRVPIGTYYVSGAFRSATYGLEFETPPLRITITAM